MTSRHFVVATAGHVDHGKSSLVKALTGIDPDRLPEEKERGITTDLGFAHFALPALGTTDGRSAIVVGIVDVPGHEDFVRNMVAGVGSADAALLVVAADDGWMPQTEEHLQILTYLGVERGVVALTKVDLISENEDDLVGDLTEQLLGTVFSSAPIIPTSTTTGRGIECLKSALAGVLMESETARDIGKPRLWVDRAFTLHGIGTIVTGTLIGGGLFRGQSVVVQPCGVTTHIRALQSHGSDLQSAVPGMRVALNLPNLVVSGKTKTQSGTVGRGSIVTLPDLGAMSKTLDVLIDQSPRSIEGRGTRQLIRQNAVIRLHLGTASFAARLVLAEGSRLEPGRQANAQLRLDVPIHSFVGDRFILRDLSARRTLAGGVVIDSDSSRRSFRATRRRGIFPVSANRLQYPADYVLRQLARDKILPRHGLLLKSRFSSEEIGSQVHEFADSGKLVVLGDHLADSDWWRTLHANAIELIDNAHRVTPEGAGLLSAELHKALGPEIPSSVFDALVADLCQHGCVLTRNKISRQTHVQQLPPSLKNSGDRLRSALAAKPLEPPSRRELAPDAASQAALRFLIETGEVVELSRDIVLSATEYGRAVESIKAFLGVRGESTTSELKQVITTTRRVMVPLLEKLDHDGVTVRQGDKRILRHTDQTLRAPTQ